MKCEICKKSIGGVIVILPIIQPDGKLDTLACEKCAHDSKAYCIKHDRPHVGFSDGSTACLWCIEEVVKVNTVNAISVSNHIKDVLPEDQVDELDEAAEAAAAVRGCTEDIAILRFIASATVRSGKKNISDKLNEVLNSRSVKCILWG